MVTENKMISSEERRPNPDPSTLTTDQLLREISHIKDTVDSAKEIIDTRLNAMDTALKLLQAFADKSPTTAAVAQSVLELAKLVDEKFTSIDRRFQDKDKAVDAAFAAAKEAVAEQNKSNALSITKSEAAFTKQLDGMNSSIAATTKTTDDKFVDLKDRITTIEGRSTGHGDIWGYIIGAVGILAAVIAIFALVSKVPNPGIIH